MLGKCAVDKMTADMAMELATEKIDIVSLYPGPCPLPRSMPSAQVHALYPGPCPMHAWYPGPCPLPMHPSCSALYRREDTLAAPRERILATPRMIGGFADGRDPPPS